MKEASLLEQETKDLKPSLINTKFQRFGWPRDDLCSNNQFLLCYYKVRLTTATLTFRIFTCFFTQLTRL
jgi:hypothetical protein